MAPDGGLVGVKCHPKGLREALAPLGARQVDAKRRPREPRTGSCAFLGPILASDWGLKSVQNRVLERCKSDSKVCYISEWYFYRFWLHFGPNFESGNVQKLSSRRGAVHVLLLLLVCLLGPFLDPTWGDFGGLMGVKLAAILHSKAPK